MSRQGIITGEGQTTSEMGIWSLQYLLKTGGPTFRSGCLQARAGGLPGGRPPCVSSPSAGAVLKEEVCQTPALGLKQQGFQLLRREPETINQNFGFRVSGIVIFANQHFLY